MRSIPRSFTALLAISCVGALEPVGEDVADASSPEAAVSARCEVQPCVPEVASADAGDAGTDAAVPFPLDAGAPPNVDAGLPPQVDAGATSSPVDAGNDSPPDAGGSDRPDAGSTSLPDAGQSNQRGA